MPNEGDPDLIDPSCDPDHPKTIYFSDIKKAYDRIHNGIIHTSCTKEAASGIIASSAGNHALGLAYHGKLLNIPVYVIMPKTVSIIKYQRCLDYDAQCFIQGANLSESKQFALKLSKLHGLKFVNGYDHPQIMAGQGTVALEIIKDVPDVNAIIVPVGGGGLISGVAVVIKSIRPEIQIIGVESTSCAGFSESLKVGKPVFTPCQQSCADGLAVPLIGSNAFHNARHLIDKIVTVDESLIHRAMLKLIEEEKCVVEGSAATSLAVLMNDQLPELKNKTVVAILTGGNIDTALLSKVIERGLVCEGKLCRFSIVVADKPEIMQELCSLLTSKQVGIKSIKLESAWSKSSIFNAQIKCICEIRSSEQAKELQMLLRTHYGNEHNVIWNEDAFW